MICGGGMKIVREVNNHSIVNYTLFENEGFINYIDYQYDYDYQRYIIYLEEVFKYLFFQSIIHSILGRTFFTYKNNI